MAFTLNDAATWVTTDILHRADADTVSVAKDQATGFYKVLCAKVPFDQLMFKTTEIPLIANTDEYDLNTYVTNPPLQGISDIRITFDPSNKRRLRRSHVRVYDALSITPPSRPATYARFGTLVQLNPPPDSAQYTIRVRYWSSPVISSPQEATPFAPPDEWFELQKWETLYRVYYALDMPDKAMSLMSPPLLPRGTPTSKKLLITEVGIIPRLWNDLLTTFSQKENVDEDFSINPVIRPYSYR